MLREVGKHELGRDVPAAKPAEVDPVELRARLRAESDPVNEDIAPLVHDHLEVGGVRVTLGWVEVIDDLVGYLLVAWAAVTGSSRHCRAACGGEGLRRCAGRSCCTDVARGLK